MVLVDLSAQRFQEGFYGAILWQDIKNLRGALCFWSGHKFFINRLFCVTVIPHRPKHCICTLFPGILEICFQFFELRTFHDQCINSFWGAC